MDTKIVVVQCVTVSECYLPLPQPKHFILNRVAFEISSPHFPPIVFRVVRRRRIFFFDPRLHSRFAKKVLGKKTCKPLSPLPRLYPTNFLSSDCFFFRKKHFVSFF